MSGYINLNLVHGANRRKGIAWQNQLCGWKVHLMNAYASTYPGFKFTLDNSVEDNTDQLLTIMYNGKTLVNPDEDKSWELLTKTGRDSNVTGMNYWEKIGKKFPACKPEDNEFRTTTFEKPNIWTPKAERMAEAQHVEVHSWASWRDRLAGKIKDIFGLERPSLLDRSSINLATVSGVVGTVSGRLDTVSDAGRVRFTDNIKGSREAALGSTPIAGNTAKARIWTGRYREVMTSDYSMMRVKIYD